MAPYQPHLASSSNINSSNCAISQNIGRTMTKVFIDGQAGTTGLQIAERLSQRSDIELLAIDAHQRKAAHVRADLLKEADIAVLCLPDQAAEESVALAPTTTRILDASSAHRVHPDWSYGLPELDADARKRIQSARLVSNPGCYPQGFILLVRPLIEAQLLASATPLRCSAVSGYTGGGRPLIETYTGYDAEQANRHAVQAYGLSQKHKHLPEMQHYSGTTAAPIFLPSVANYDQGMLVQIALFEHELSGASARTVQKELAERYIDEPFICVAELNDPALLDGSYLNPTQRNGSNMMDLAVFGDDSRVVLTARYDNLGKGAAGAAIQNLNLMLGIDECTAL